VIDTVIFFEINDRYSYHIMFYALWP